MMLNWCSEPLFQDYCIINLSSVDVWWQTRVQYTYYAAMKFQPIHCDFYRTYKQNLIIKSRSHFCTRLFKFNSKQPGESRHF